MIPVSLPFVQLFPSEKFYQNEDRKIAFLSMLKKETHKVPTREMLFLRKIIFFCSPEIMVTKYAVFGNTIFPHFGVKFSFRNTLLVTFIPVWDKQKFALPKNR